MRLGWEAVRAYRQIRCAEGYLELGMSEDAWEELKGLKAPYEDFPDVLLLRIRIELTRGHLDEALVEAGRGISDFPDAGVFYFLKACVLEQLGNSRGAKGTLMQSPEEFHRTDAYHYNLARYECALGNRKSAEEHLEQALSLNGKILRFLRFDPALQDLFDEMGD